MPPTSAWPNASWFALLPPLVGTVLCGFFARSLGKAGTVVVACGAVLAAFVASCAVAWQAPAGPLSAPFQWSWVDLPGFHASFSALADGLTGVMLLVVTGVGFLIHCYSAGYMAHEPDHGRFFAWLNLFVAAMVTLVVAGSLPMLLVGWGGVGFASYALIGFECQRPSAVKAARKAFVINLVGDLALMLAIFRMASVAPDGDLSLSPDNLQAVAQDLGPGAFLVAALLLVAAYAKSAQFPLHTWLPDAMEGPTPVSALIHAATMVTAGVYLVIRMGPVFQASPGMQVAVALLGGFSALYAASAALTQTDLKRVLAWSTISQLGYMFMAAGVGAYAAALFHLVTHAFFKALLFLTAGVVIHALHGQQDMRRMGGLRSSLPLAWGAFLVGTLALTGTPLFSGFFSKEEILLALYSAGRDGSAPQALPGGLALWRVGLATSVLTSFYMFRALFLTFHGPARHGREDLHPPATSMAWTLATLAGLAIFGGLLNLPHPWTLGGLLPAGMVAAWLAPVAGLASEPAAPLWAATGLPVLAMLAGLGGAWVLVLLAPPPDPARESRVARFLRSGLGVDAAYGAASQWVHRAATLLQGPFEEAASGRAPGDLASAVLALGRAVGATQAGGLRGYALTLVVALVVLLVLAVLLAGGGL